MDITHTPPQTTSSQADNSSADTDQQRLKQAFYISALQVSWQLAVVVLLPIVGGAKLDDARHSSPLWTLLGFGLAVVLTGLILWRQLKKFSPNVQKDAHS